MRLRSVSLLFTVALMLVGSAFADSCEAFLTYSCAKHVYSGDTARINPSTFSTISQPITILATSTTFGVGLSNSKSIIGDTVLIAAAFPGAISGTLTASNGVTSGFTALSGGIPEKGSTGAIVNTWTGLGISYSSSFASGIADLGTVNSSSFSFTANGVPKGTILYAIIVNSKGQIIAINPNSEAAVLGVGTVATPEPASLTLLGTGLIGLAGFARRKMKKS